MDADLLRHSIEVRASKASPHKPMEQSSKTQRWGAAVRRFGSISLWEFDDGFFLNLGWRLDDFRGSSPKKMVV